VRNYQYVVIDGCEYPCTTADEVGVAGEAMKQARLARVPLMYRTRKEDDPSSGQPCPDKRELKEKITIAEIVKLPRTHHNRAFAGIGGLIVDQHEDSARGLIYQIDHQRQKFRRTSYDQPFPDFWENDAQNT
jgi:hypothetical protein